ncbi:DUF2029 domain-containing protein [bacterium]|nr:DUF2029 domain-containing protein [bacterium]
MQIFWEKYGNRILRMAVVLLAIAATFRLLHESLRLVIWDLSTLGGPNDLRNFQNAMKGLFAGQPIYKELGTSPYPPASYAIFWPFLGWLDLSKARLLWAITLVAVLAWLIVLIIRESKATSHTERILAALFLLSMNGTGVTIGNGQLGLHILPALVTALLLIQHKDLSIQNQFFASLLVLFALAKPTISVPFLWILLFAPHGKRILFLTSIAYLAITWLALSFQPQPAIAVFESWFHRASIVALERGYGNLHAFLSSINLDSWMAPASLFVFGLFGLWVYFHRKVEIWLVIGITALVARFWSYHRYYDDVLIILPMISLFRIAKSSGLGNRRRDARATFVAGFLLSMIAFFNLARLHNISKLRFELITSTNVILWMLTTAFLLYLAQRQKVEAKLVSS